jgi:outer membrane protein TolC
MLPLAAAVLAAATLLPPARAQEPQEGSPLGFTEAVSLALNNAEAIKIAETKVEEARLQRSKALKSVWPDLAASFSWDYFSVPGGEGSPQEPKDAFAWSLGLNQPLYTGGRATSAVRTAERGIRLSALAESAVREEIFLGTVRAYFGALTAAQVVEAARQGVAAADDFLSLVRRRFDLGEVTRTSVLRAEMELLRSQDGLTRAEGGQALAIRGLERLTGRPVTRVSPATVDPAPAELRDLNALVERALASRKELLMAGERTGMADEGVVFARGRFLPFAYANAYYRKSDGEFPPEETEAWGFTLNLAVPIYDRGQSRSDLALAKNAHRRSLLEEEDLRREVRLEVQDKFIRLADLESASRSLARGVDLAEENLRGTRIQYEVGLATDLDMVTALAAQMAARVGRANADYELLLGTLELRRAAGILSIPQ